MELTRYTPGYRKSRNEFLPNLFDEFFSPFFTESPVGQAVSRQGMSVDIYEDNGKIIIEAEIPGVNKEDLYVDVKGKHLTLGGERKTENEVKDENVYRRERRQGKFYRTFTLPFEVKEDLVTACYNNGILKLEVSRPHQEEVKQIKIN